jgi:chromosome segregation ATPase
MMMDEAQAKADHATELLEVLQKSKQSELSDKVIEMSEKLSKIRLNELRANRESSELKEKHNYLSRLLKTQVDSIKKLEE